MIDDCGFEFRDNSFVGDGYLLYATREYNGKLFDGVDFVISSNDYYFISTDERLSYIVDGVYYRDIVYCRDGVNYLDEEYLGWLVWNYSSLSPGIVFWYY